MLKRPVAKNARSKRALENRKSKVIENPKIRLVVRGTTSNSTTSAALKDLHALFKPNSLLFSKKNDLHPFDDPRSMEFLSLKNDASLFVIGSNSKKRPNQLLFARLFNHELYDLCEFGIENFVSIEELRGRQSSSGQKPLLLFSGMAFETHPTMQSIKNMFLDFFSGNELIPSVHLAGIEHIIHIAIDPLVDPYTSDNARLLFRCYSVQMSKDKNSPLAKGPRVELTEMGPRMDLCVRRQRWPSNELKRAANKVPKVVKPSKVKNVSKDILGDTVGRVHVGRQDLSQLQTRKVKALKKSHGFVDGSVDSATLNTDDDEESMVSESDMEDDAESNSGESLYSEMESAE